MGIHYKSLSNAVRRKMLNEISLDESSGTIYISQRLAAGKRDAWINLLKEAASSHTDTWLEQQIRTNNLLLTQEPRKTKNGTTMAQVPSNAPEMLSEGEFNRYYMRAVCVQAIEDSQNEVVIYRGKAVEKPRPESQAKIGTKIPPNRLLDDLRRNPGVDTALGLPSGPNSGLTIKKIND